MREHTVEERPQLIAQASFGFALERMGRAPVTAECPHD